MGMFGMNNSKLEQKYSRYVKWIWDNFEHVWGAFFISIVVICLFVQVFFRYVLGRSLAWSEELSRFAFLWMVYTCVSIGAKDDSHIRVTAQFKVLPEKMKRFFLAVSDLLWIFFNMIVVYESYIVYCTMVKFPQISPVLYWNIKYVMLIIPLGFALQTYRVCERYYLHMKYGQTMTIKGS